jgi:alpha-D-ribose 1-methylphosphonate 5-triphosphate synthase subunit PhnH
MRPLGTSSIGTAFADPAHDAQAGFRAILAAMAEPGTIHHVSSAIAPPTGIDLATAISLLTLADHETPIWLAPSFGAEAVSYLRFHCGAPVVSARAEAAFAVARVEDAVDIAAFNPGDDRYPDRSATIILQCPALTGGAAVTLTGPGIRHRRAIAPLGVRPDLWRQLEANHARFPLGVDVLLTAGATLLALPRSTAVTGGKEPG